VASARGKLIQRYIAANVLRLRVRRGLTQEELAEAVGVEPRYVQEIERARSNLSIAVLVGLARALGVDERALLKPATLPPPRAGRPPKRTSARRRPSR
jgi:transcriptional regulator with XRE-family HTH domain